jgi:hypothetical protein
MTTALALEYIPQRMQELGHGKNYYIRFRHIVLQGNEKLEIESFNQYFILVEEPENVKIVSDFGIYDLSNDRTNEQFYEHQGNILITNYSATITHLRFIQVIPVKQKQN